MKVLSLMDFIKRAWKPGKFLIAYAARLARLKCAGSAMVYPRVVNYSTTNKCNLRCVMCNVWRPEHSSGEDMSPSDLERVLRKPLFKKVEHVGLSGGEPFLRKDIRAVVAAVSGALPSLKGLSIITNATLPHAVERLMEIKKDLSARGVALDVEVSIDGVGEAHDGVRGVAKAFDRAAATLEKMRALGLVNRISATITSRNCASLWRTYRFARDRGIRIDFRLASVIGRLHNEGLHEGFRLGTMDTLRVVKFLENIVFYYEKDDLDKQLFYTSLIGQMKGGARRSGCEFSTSRGVSLDPYGNLYFCFVRSAPIADINDKTPCGLELLKKNAGKLRDTWRHCNGCTHDYWGVSEPGLVAAFFRDRYIRERLNNARNGRALRRRPAPGAQTRAQAQKVSIIGWYGTETLGDKAILGGIIDNLKRDGIAPGDMTVVSLHPAYTELSLMELAIDGVRVADAYRVKSDLDFIRSQDLFIFGGGPLCDIEPMLDMLTIFINSRQCGKTNHIYAAGIGPLKEKRYIEALRKMLACTDRCSFRDALSVEKYGAALPELDGLNPGVFIDPATNYIRARASLIGRPAEAPSRYAVFSFRDWLYMYADGLSVEEFEAKNAAYEQKMAALVRKVVDDGLTVILLPMSTFYRGGDDREYYLDFLKRLDCRDGVVLLDRDLTPMDALSYFKHAEFAVCLRFHSVVFSVAANTPCIAIDYHYGKGKITGFMSAVGLAGHVYGMDEFIAADMDAMVRKARGNGFDWARVRGILDDRNEALYAYMSVRGRG